MRGESGDIPLDPVPSYPYPFGVKGYVTARPSCIPSLKGAGEGGVNLLTLLTPSPTLTPDT